MHWIVGLYLHSNGSWARPTILLRAPFLKSSGMLLDSLLYIIYVQIFFGSLVGTYMVFKTQGRLEHWQTSVTPYSRFNSFSYPHIMQRYMLVLFLRKISVYIYPRTDSHTYLVA
ncbi:hypothetical protein GYMLUDRAFT_643052 [Collybiopsis luxurians FD-317 M1]|nr:hypothetical protein GYMLUDRAFT_643052 [Collybiopsis luxurians FD-317 M1]